MSFFAPQNPGIGGLDELTNAEELFLTTFASLTYTEGDVLKIEGGTISWEPSNTYETVSKNLKAYPATINYSGTDITSIVYTLPSGTITKTLNFTGDQLTSITLSGSTPTGINLTKTLSYTGDNLTGISYS